MGVRNISAKASAHILVINRFNFNKYITLKYEHADLMLQWVEHRRYVFTCSEDLSLILQLLNEHELTIVGNLHSRTTCMYVRVCACVYLCARIWITSKYTYHEFDDKITCTRLVSTLQNTHGQTITHTEHIRRFALYQPRKTSNYCTDSLTQTNISRDQNLILPFISQDLSH